MSRLSLVPFLYDLCLAICIDCDDSDSFYVMTRQNTNGLNPACLFLPTLLSGFMTKTNFSLLCVLLILALPILGNGQPALSFSDKPCRSYSSSTELRWGDAPVNDFGPLNVKFDFSGIRPLNPVPPPGIHPRILITPRDLPELRSRLRNTHCGQMMWNKILSYSNALRGNYDEHADYAKPDVWNGRFGGSHGHVRLLYYHEAGNPFNPKNRGYARLISGDPTVNPGPYWSVMSMEAFRCLIEDDRVAGANLGKAVLTAMRHDQASSDQERAAKHQNGPDRSPGKRRCRRARTGLDLRPGLQFS